MAYARAKEFTKAKKNEPVAKESELDQCLGDRHDDEDLDECVELCQGLCSEGVENMEKLMAFDYGTDNDWSIQNVHIHLTIASISATKHYVFSAHMASIGT